MKITFKVTQEEIDKAGVYEDNFNCLGCTVLKRVLGVDYINMGISSFVFWEDSYVDLDLKFADYLDSYCSGKVKPETHSIDIPDSVLEQIGYFDKKGDTFVDDYTTKENNIEVRKLPKETKHQRNTLVEEESH